jgi:5-methyltetrahydrofolate--homocysteine methyltransferase
MDLGNDVSADRIVAEIRKNGTRFVGLSALLTTTMREMAKVVQMLKEEGLDEKVHVLIGGAPTSEEFAQQIGADAHCRDAFHAIEILRNMEA